MNVKQISTILNGVFGEVLGDGLIAEDLSNIVSAGQIITGSSTFADQFENYAGKIVDKVGRTVFVDKLYKAKDLGFWRDSFEYGSVLEKIRCDVGDFTDNAEWDLTKDTDADDDLDYNENISTHVQDMFKFYPANVQAKYFNAKTTFKTTISITRKQLKSAFDSASKMARFIGMIENRVSSKMEIAKDQLQRRALANLIGEKIYNAKYVDLRAEYAADTGTNIATITTSMTDALNDKDILRYIAKKISFDREMLTVPSTLYTDGEFYTHTPEADSRLIVIADLDKGLAFNLYGDTYNEEFVKLDNYKTIPFWQANGKDAATRSAIKITTSANHNVNQGYVVASLVDKNAVMICNETPEVRSQYNPDGNFYNYFHSFDCSYYNDFDENAIIYTWGNTTIAAITATLAKGTNSGTTAVTATANNTGDGLYCKVTDDAPTIVPGMTFIDTTGWVTLTSGTKYDNITATAGQYITVIERNGDGIVVAAKQAKLTASNIQS